MDAYHNLQAKFAEFHEVLGITIQHQADRAEQQEAAERDLEARQKDVEERETKSREQESRIRSLEVANARMHQEVNALRAEITRVDEDSETTRKKLAENMERQSPKYVLKPSEMCPSCCSRLYRELERNYTSLYKEKGALVESYSLVAAKLKRCKTRFQEWERLFKHDKIDIVVDGEHVTFKRVDTGESSKDATTTPTAASRQQAEELPYLPAIPQRRERRPGAPAVTPTQRGPSDEEPSSTQSQDPRWPAQESCQISEGFSDAPTLVATRSIRKRCSAEQSALKDAQGSHDAGSGSAGRPITVKSESSSSASTRRAPLFTSSSDGVGNVLDEPPRPGPAPEHPCRPQDAAFPVFHDEHRREVQSSPPDERSQRGAELPPRASKRRALQPLDGNGAAQRANVQRATARGTKRQRDETRGAKAVPSVAEDGEEELPQKGQRTHNASKRRATMDVTRDVVSGDIPPGGRLSKLLGEPAGPKPVLTPSPRSAIAGKPSHAQARTPGESTTTPVARSERTMRASFTPSRRSKSVSRRREAINGLYEGSKPDGAGLESEPYRARPVHRLELSHFKINPERNHGLDFPFQEVIRNKEERKCLSGCVRPDCCGPIFRSMAVEGRLGRPGVSESVSLTDLDQEDRALLEQYLGDDKDTLESMPDSELREALIDARSRDLANQYGRHRYAHERARTPPGFWQTDMPDTQENQQYRERADEMDRVKVLERYRDAMRPDGLWKFADE